MTFRRLGAPLLGAFLAACTAMHDDFSAKVLQPPAFYLVEPTTVEPAAEPFTIAVGSDATLTGYWLPNPAADGRTVVLFHDADTNVGAIHPWYRYLHEAGFQVCVFDPRGYGKSAGTPNLRGWLYDAAELVDWLVEERRIDLGKTAFFGTGLGANAAGWVAKRHPECAGLVIEGLTSARELLRDDAGDTSAAGAFGLGFREFAALPENFELADNAPELKQPALFVLGEREDQGTRRALLAAFDAYAGPRSLWLLPTTGRAPNGMATHDGEYQRTIGDFLHDCFARKVAPWTVGWRKVGASSDGQAFYEVAIAGPAIDGPVAVEAAALADGKAAFASTWLEGRSGKLRLKLSAEPTHVSVNRIAMPVSDDDGGARRALTPLARASRDLGAMFARLETVRFGEPTLDECRALAAELTSIATEAPFPPVIEAELADVFAKIGLALAASKDAGDVAAATAWLQRAVAAVPAAPERHFWAGPMTTYGYPQAEAVAAAKRKLDN